MSIARALRPFAELMIWAAVVAIASGQLIVINDQSYALFYAWFTLVALIVLTVGGFLMGVKK